MKKRMRTRYTFHDINGNFIGHGDCPNWAAKVRAAWGDKAIETREQVMYVTNRPQGAIGTVKY